jgi:hypothetical protein
MPLESATFLHGRGWALSNGEVEKQVFRQLGFSAWLDFQSYTDFLKNGGGDLILLVNPYRLEPTSVERAQKDHGHCLCNN